MKIIVGLVFCIFFLHADATLTQLFKELKTVSKENKFKVVNQIKEHIIALKQKERVNAIKILQEKKKAEKKSLTTVKNEMLSKTVESSCVAETMDKSVPVEMKKNMLEMKNMPTMIGMKNITKHQEMMSNQQHQHNLPMGNRMGNR